MSVHKPSLNIYDNCVTEQDMLLKLENLARNKVKVPLKNNEYSHSNVNINRSDASDYIADAAKM